MRSLKVPFARHESTEGKQTYQFHSFLTLAFDGVQWVVLRPDTDCLGRWISPEPVWSFYDDKNLFHLQGIKPWID